MESKLCQSILTDVISTSNLTGAQIQTVIPKNGRYMTLEEIQENVTLDDDVHG